MDSFVVGVDGCRGGWLVCRYEPAASILSYEVFPVFQDVLDAYDQAAVVAVDIPIGLRDDWGPRRCDLEARAILKARPSSVFPAPPRCLLKAQTYNEACQISLEKFGRKLSKQTFFICPKILEVDHVMTIELQSRIFEVHPELSFQQMAGQALTHSKKKPVGYEERRTLLNQNLPSVFRNVKLWHELGIPFGMGVQRDDALDAAAAAWTAFRIHRNQAWSIPSIAEFDASGLRMAITV
jgi:predicted RNase H-like nuclease